MVSYAMHVVCGATNYMCLYVWTQPLWLGEIVAEGALPMVFKGKAAVVMIAAGSMHLPAHLFLTQAELVDPKPEKVANLCFKHFFYLMQLDS